LFSGKDFWHFSRGYTVKAKTFPIKIQIENWITKAKDIATALEYRKNMSNPRHIRIVTPDDKAQIKAIRLGSL
jgi:hypothetical protein